MQAAEDCERAKLNSLSVSVSSGPAASPPS
jgi:hypothetical protein